MLVEATFINDDYHFAVRKELRHGTAVSCAPCHQCEEPSPIPSLSSGQKWGADDCDDDKIRSTVYIIDYSTVPYGRPVSKWILDFWIFEGTDMQYVPQYSII